MNATAMFVLFLVGFLVGTYAIALIAKFIGEALRPTLPSIEAPVQKIVVRRRTVQVGTQAEAVYSQQTPDKMTRSSEKPRPKVTEAGIGKPILTT